LFSHEPTTAQAKSETYGKNAEPHEKPMGLHKKSTILNLDYEIKLELRAGTHREKRAKTFALHNYIRNYIPRHRQSSGWVHAHQSIGRKAAAP